MEGPILLRAQRLKSTFDPVVWRLVLKIKVFFISQKVITTECVADLDSQLEMIIFESILTTFELSITL